LKVKRYDAVDDFELIRHFQEGKRWAFDALMKRHEKRVYRLILGIVGDQESAADIVQETFIRAFGSLDRFQFRASFSTWVHRIAVNLCLSKLRRDRLNPLQSLSELSNLLTSTFSRPGQDLATRELGQQIEEAVAALPPKQRAIFVMRQGEDLSYTEIAKVMGRSEGAIRASYFQAVRKLRRSLQDHE
jgi:RNA polymerase sigma factor (sigma-70 family)